MGLPVFSSYLMKHIFKIGQKFSAYSYTQVKFRTIDRKTYIAQKYILHNN